MEICKDRQIERQIDGQLSKQLIGKQAKRLNRHKNICSVHQSDSQIENRFVCLTVVNWTVWTFGQKDRKTEKELDTMNIWTDEPYVNWAIKKQYIYRKFDKQIVNLSDRKTESELESMDSKTDRQLDSWTD